MVLEEKLMSTEEETRKTERETDQEEMGAGAPEVGWVLLAPIVFNAVLSLFHAVMFATSVAASYFSAIITLYLVSFFVAVAGVVGLMGLPAKKRIVGWVSILVSIVVLNLSGMALSEVPVRFNVAYHSTVTLERATHDSPIMYGSGDCVHRTSAENWVRNYYAILDEVRNYAAEMARKEFLETNGLGEETNTQIAISNLELVPLR